MKDFLMLSFNNLKRRKLRSWLTLLGIFIGIASVVSLISLGDGLRTAITGQFNTLSTDKLTIQNAGTGFGPPGSTVVKKLNEHDMRVIESVEGVEFAVPRLIRMGRIEYNGEVEFFYLADIPDDKKQQEIIYSAVNVKTQTGRLIKTGDHGKVIVGNSILDEKNFGKRIETGKKLKINGQDLEVVGTLKKSSSFQVNFVILMSTEDMKRVLNIEDEIDLIIVQVKKGYDPAKVSEDIIEKLRKDRDEKKGEEDFSVQTPLQALSSVNTILNVINAVVTGIAAISLIVGAMGIANTMYTSVLERTNEIGTMKAIGARNSDVLLLFVIESGLLGLVGGIIGAIAGAGMAYSASAGANSFFGENIFNFQFNWFLFFGAIGFSFLIGVLSGILPAFQASRLKPAEALRA